MNVPDAAAVLLAVLAEATDQVQTWGNTPRVDLTWGEVEVELYAMLREDDPDVGSNPRFRITARIDLPACYAIQRSDEGEEDFLTDDVTLAAFEMELRLAPSHSLWNLERLEALAVAVSDWPAAPGCQVDFGNDELPYRHTLSFETCLTKGDFLAEFDWRAEEIEERPRLTWLFRFLIRALVEAKRSAC